MSEFRLYPVPQSKLDNLTEICTRVGSEMNPLRAKDAKSMIALLHGFYTQGMMDVYVDDLENPSHMLVMSLTPSIWNNDIVATVLLIYSYPEARGDIDVLKAFMRTYTGYAMLKGATAISGSSWVLNGHKGTDAIWKADKFDHSETVYTKYLT